MKDHEVVRKFREDIRTALDNAVFCLSLAFREEDIRAALDNAVANQTRMPPCVNPGQDHYLTADAMELAQDMVYYDSNLESFQDDVPLLLPYIKEWQQDRLADKWEDRHRTACPKCGTRQPQDNLNDDGTCAACAM